MRTKRSDRITRLLAALVEQGVVYSADDVLANPELLNKAASASKLTERQERQAAQWLLTQLQQL